MCTTVFSDPDTSVHGSAYFRKDNWPEDQALIWDVIAYKCACGQRWFVAPKKEPWRLMEAVLEKSA